MPTSLTQKLAAGILCLLLPLSSFAQADVEINGATIEIGGGGMLYVNGSMELNGSTQITNHGTIELIGDWYNHATGSVFVPGSSGWVLFTGASQLIGGSAPTNFPSLGLLGSDNKVLGNPISIADTFSLGSRNLNAALYTVTVLNTDNNAITTNGGFVYTGTAGALVRYMDDTVSYSFPMGEIASGTYRPVTFKPTTLGTSQLSLQQKYYNPTFDGYDISLRDSAICNIHMGFYNLARPLSGTTLYDVAMAYNPATAGNYNNLAAWGGNQWDTTASNTNTTAGGFNWVSASQVNLANPQPLALANNIAKPVIGYASGQGYCEGDTLVLSVSPGFMFYEWSNGSLNDTAWILADGNYDLTVTEAFNCWAVAAPVAISFDTITAPVLSAVGLTSICNGDTLMVTAPAGYATYNWSNGSSNDTVYLTAAGLYNLTVSNGTACLASAANDVELVVNNPVLPSLVAGNTFDICAQDSIELAVLGTFNSYNWQGGSTDSTELVYNSGTYVVTVEDSNGCASTDSISISRSNLPSPVADFSFAINGNQLDLTDQSTNANHYSWAINGNLLDTLANTSYQLPGSGSYNVCLTVSNDCESVTACDTVVFTGIDRVGWANLQLYPNPTADFVTISIPSLKETAQCRLTNMLGQQLLTATVVPSGSTQVDLRGLAAGNYNLEIEAGQQRQTYTIQLIIP